MTSEDSHILGPEWHISQQGLKLLDENGTFKDKSKLLKAALDSDLKAIGKSVLSTELTKTRTSKFVVQVQKIRNISAPKANENSQAAPRMLKLTLTDGESYVQAIEACTIGSVSRDKTAPGTKLLIDTAPVVSGYLLLSPSNCTVLGGQVPHLYEKWLLAKSVQESQKYGRKTSSDGAPPWVNFGTKVVDDQEKSFKSLDKDKASSKENSEFDLQRQEAIAEAASLTSKKTFGGRAKQNIQPQNKKPTDGQDRFRKSKQSVQKEDVEEKLQKPLEKVSLFDFLESKLPPTETQVQASYQPKSNEGLRSNQQSSYHSQNQKRALPQNDFVNRSDRNRPFNKFKLESNQVTSSSNQTYVNKPNSNYNSYHKPERPANNFNGTAPKSYSSSNNRDSTASSRQHHSVRDIETISNNMSKVTVSNNNEFAKRSLRQHLNLAQAKVQNEPTNTRGGNDTLAIGNKCMAKYWEDGKFYNAVVTGVTETTYVVKFSGYGNIEEVLKTDCFSPSGSLGYDEDYQRSGNREGGGFYGSMEFRGRTPRNK